jgi:hypothetical protein
MGTHRPEATSLYYRSGLPCVAAGTMPSADSACAVGGVPTPPSQLPWHAPSQDSHEVSRGKSSSRRCIDAGFIKHAPLWMEDFVVACPLVPGVPHLLSGSCSSPRTCAPRFLQTPPHGDALALRLSFGSTFTWTGDSHPPAVRHARHTRLRLSRRSSNESFQIQQELLAGCGRPGGDG